MARFAEIKEGKVVNIIVADTKETAEQITGNTCIEHDVTDQVDLGDLWDGTQFFKPTVIEVIEGETIA